MGGVRRCLKRNGGEPGLAPPDELLKVGDKVGDGRRSWVDRHQSFVNRDESQVHGAGFASLAIPLPFELARELLGSVSRRANGNREVLLDSVHATGPFEV